MSTDNQLENKTVTILGLGWLGKALALSLIEDGATVQGTVTSQQNAQDLKNDGIDSYVYQIGELLPQYLVGVGIFIITVPPRGAGYIEKLERTINQLSVESKVIYISSTSIYPDTNGLVKEGDEVDKVSPHSGISIYQVEKVFKNQFKYATVVRMAGLYGPGRKPGKFLTGKYGVKGPENPVNLVHQEDCIGIIKSVIIQNSWGEAINACADEHPTREEFYTAAAIKLGLTPPEFSDEAAPFKIVSNEKSKTLLNYTYQHPDPIKGLI